jgi:hypothetical protein
MACERRPLGLLVEPWNPQRFTVGKLPPVTGHLFDQKPFREGVGEHLSHVTVLKPLKFLSNLIKTGPGHIADLFKRGEVDPDAEPRFRLFSSPDASRAMSSRMLSMRL